MSFNCMFLSKIVFRYSKALECFATHRIFISHFVQLKVGQVRNVIENIILFGAFIIWISCQFSCNIAYIVIRIVVSAREKNRW